MKKILTVLMALSMLAAVLACADGAETLYETARFEELQNNPAHALELYEEIARKHPGSEYAGRAEERLRELRGNPR